MTALIRVEWLKLVTTRLLRYMLPAALVLSIAAVSGAVLSAESAGISLETNAGIRRSLHVSATGALLMLVIGIVM